MMSYPGEPDKVCDFNSLYLMKSKITAHRSVLRPLKGLLRVREPIEEKIEETIEHFDEEEDSEFFKMMFQNQRMIEQLVAVQACHMEKKESKEGQAVLQFIASVREAQNAFHDICLVLNQLLPHPRHQPKWWSSDVVLLAKKWLMHHKYIFVPGILETEDDFNEVLGFGIKGVP
jgi:hypothetical protein